MKNTKKRVSNDFMLQDPVISGDLLPDAPGKGSLGSVTKKFKSAWIETLNVMATVTTFATIALSATANQIVMGTFKKTTISSTSPANDQTVEIVDSGVANTKFTLQDCGSQQNINSNLNVANNALITPSSTFLKSGLFLVHPDANS